MTVRVRFAPSPTGLLHFGNLRTAIFNWLFSKKKGGQFLLRLEDTDKARTTKEAVDSVFDSLRWIGIEPDEKVYYQSQKLKNHQVSSERLLALGKAYKAGQVSFLTLPSAKSAIEGNVPDFIPFLDTFLKDADNQYVARKAAFEAKEASKVFDLRREYRDPLTLVQVEPQDQAVFFRLPLQSRYIEHTEEVFQINVHPKWPVLISMNGVEYVTKTDSHTGNENYGDLVFDIQQRALTGFQRAEAIDAKGNVVYSIGDDLEKLKAGKVEVLGGIVAIRGKRSYSVFKDIVKGELRKPLESLRNRVIMRSDKTPVFHLANVVDDIDQKITHVLRGDDHVENTYWHIFLFEVLSGSAPKYGHFPMIVNKDGKPYSKRDGDVSVASFKDRGILPDAFFNYLVLLGWSPGDNREKMSRQEIINVFTNDRVKATAAQFDIAKLENLNGQYIREMETDALSQACRPFMEAALGKPRVDALDSTWFRAFINVEKSRLTRLTDVVGPESRYFFDDCTSRYWSNPKITPIIQHPGSAEVLDRFGEGVLALLVDTQKSVFVGEDGYSLEEATQKFDDLFKTMAEKFPGGMKDIGPVLRAVLTGGLVSPPLGQLCALLGTSLINSRLDKARFVMKIFNDLGGAFDELLGSGVDTVQYLREYVKDRGLSAEKDADSWLETARIWLDSNSSNSLNKAVTLLREWVSHWPPPACGGDAEKCKCVYAQTEEFLKGFQPSSETPKKQP